MQRVTVATTIIIIITIVTTSIYLWSTRGKIHSSKTMTHTNTSAAAKTSAKSAGTTAVDLQQHHKMNISNIHLL